MLRCLQVHIAESCTFRNRPLAPWLLLLVTLVLEFSAQSKLTQAVLIVHFAVDSLWLLGELLSVPDDTTWGWEAVVGFVGIKLIPASVVWYVYEPTLLCKIALAASNWYYLPFIALLLVRAFLINDLMPMDINWGVFTYRRRVQLAFQTETEGLVWLSAPPRTAPPAA